MQKSAGSHLLAFFIGVRKYSNFSYICRLPNLSPTESTGVQECIKRVFYYSVTIERNYNLKI